MGSAPLVTAIIIVLNGERYIDEAIRSIVDQSLARWELLVVDDGSADGTRDRVAHWCDRDARIRLLRHPDHGNHGMSASRNLGLETARGTYVGFLDADDVWTPEKLAQQVAILEREPDTAMVYGRTLIWHDWSEGGRPNFFYDLGVAPDRTYAPPRIFLQLLRNVYQTPTTCNALMRTDRCREVGGFHDEFRTLFEDQVFFAKMLACFPVHVADACWAKYRQYPGGTSSYDADDATVRRLHLAYLRAVDGYLARRPGLHLRGRAAIWRKIGEVRAEPVLRSVRRKLRRFVSR
ncbi:glycosyltransferase family 2 protein [Novosphingobium mangrovi (ex Huang et al. 2023)]|uniref:Glycosyltransferase n=1 Tax=Novosphingobium mangrovi (ex Huang et al. 2023) TaxID=2976432 RepID=A0ABT2I9I8_9SPHN|nr:glycosyltransferase family 2 protein [Novosphingobium mangrovi (ex Huang et al. 2023)]MCT2401505.1 glycosyltransferase [Novosphingobium mangrovi (ex Huang et al. 2023)]